MVPGDGLVAMDGPSSRRDGAPRLLDSRRTSVSDGDTEPGRDVKTHFRVCRFIMDSGERERENETDRQLSAVVVVLFFRTKVDVNVPFVQELF